MNNKPFFLIDIDGVLNPDWSNSEAKKNGIRRIWHVQSGSVRYRMLLNPTHGSWLNELSEFFQLVWATTWQDEANDAIRHKLGIPELPVIYFTSKEWVTNHSKVPDVLNYVGDTPFVWIEDDLTDRDREMLKNSGTNHRIFEIDPKIGFQREHVDAALKWNSELP